MIEGRIDVVDADSVHLCHGSALDGLMTCGEQVETNTKALEQGRITETNRPVSQGVLFLLRFISCLASRLAVTKSASCYARNVLLKAEERREGEPY